MTFEYNAQRKLSSNKIVSYLFSISKWHILISIGEILSAIGDSLYSVFLEQYWLISDNNVHVFPGAHVHCSIVKRGSKGWIQILISKMVPFY